MIKSAEKLHESHTSIMSTTLHDDSEKVTSNSHDQLPKIHETSHDTPLHNSTGEKMSRVRELRDQCGAVVNDNRVQVAIIVLIIINAIQMGIGTFDFVEDNQNVQRGFDITDKVFLVIFTIELGMQFVYHGARLVLDGWLLFDLIVVVLSWSLQGLQIVRAFRVFRAFRLITRLDTLKNLVTAIFAVAPSMSAIVALLALILYIFGVLCTELYRDIYEEVGTEYDYFGSLDKSLFTLFTMVTLDGWSNIVRSVMLEEYWSSFFVFSGYLAITSFILYSLVIAVVCDAVNVAEHSGQKERDAEKKVETQVRIYNLHVKVEKSSRDHRRALQAIRAALRQLDIATTESKDTTPRAVNGTRSRYLLDGRCAEDFSIIVDEEGDESESRSESGSATRQELDQLLGQMPPPFSSRHYSTTSTSSSSPEAAGMRVPCAPPRDAFSVGDSSSNGSPKSPEERHKELMDSIFFY